MIWFTADQHFGHEAIIDLACRPFDNLRSMEKTIIQKHNSVVDKNDDVYFIGDLYWGNEPNRLENILKKLNGNKYLILGNHDKIKPFAYQEIGIKQVATWLELDEFILAHDPSLSCIDRTKKFICGHIHDLFTFYKNVVNVGVDVWNFCPVSLFEIKARTGRINEINVLSKREQT